MSFLFPAKSLTKYNIANKEIIVIGEEHTNKTNTDTANVILTWDFITQKMKEGYGINVELAPDFHKNADKIMKHIHSVNIRKTLQKIKKMNKIKQVNGMDFRRRGDFFGLFGNSNIQAYFFNKSAELGEVNIWQFLVVMDNIMVFVNKHFYNSNIKDLILHINKDFLDQLAGHHQNVDKHSRALKQIIQRDSKGKPKGFVYKFKDINPLLKKAKYPFNINKIVDDYRDFVLIFSDLITLVEMLHKKEKKQLLLIGNAHAKNLNYFLKNYIQYPYIHPKMSSKERKLAGSEIKGKKHTVYIKFLK